MGLINESKYKILRVYAYIQEQSNGTAYWEWKTTDDFQFIGNKTVIDYLLDIFLNSDKTAFRNMSQLVESDHLLQHKGSLENSPPPKGEVRFRAITSRGYSNFKRKRERDYDVPFDAPITLPKERLEFLIGSLET